MTDRIEPPSRARSWLRNVSKIVRGRQRWSAASEFEYYAVSRRVVDEHRARQDVYAAECWFSGMQIMRAMGILDTRIVGGAKVLDVGAGECVLAGALARCGASEVWAIDAVPKQIWAAAEKLGASGTMKFVITGATDLPFADSSFDLITANLVLHHIEPIAPVAGEVFRCLAPGGRFVAAEPTPIVGTLIHEQTSENEAPIPARSVVAELTRAGFVDVTSSYLWVRLASSALGPLSPSYVITAKKPGSSRSSTSVSLRRPLTPMRLAGLQLDQGCTFAEHALDQERQLLSFVRG